jgi:hypothetical protein
MNRRTRRTLWIVAAVLAFLAAAIFLRSKAPPEAARLLPESDGIIYINLKPMRGYFHKELKPPQHLPEYQQFIDATGIDWERDLDEAAIALHRMSNPNGPNGPVAYSLVLVGKITGKKLNAWLDAHATSRELYAGHTIYSIPSEGRTVRVAQIGYNMVAVSNTPTPEQIHSMLDRHATAAWPFAGSTLLREHYHEVPLLAIAWGVGQIGLPFSDGCDGGSGDQSASHTHTQPHTQPHTSGCPSRMAAMEGPAIKAPRIAATSSACPCPTAAPSAFLGFRCHSKPIRRLWPASRRRWSARCTCGSRRRPPATRQPPGKPPP